MKLYSTEGGLVIEHDQQLGMLPPSFSFDRLFAAAEPLHLLREQMSMAQPVTQRGRLLAPLGSQEVWAAGVTYFRSRTARMEESKDAGGGTFYDRVYEADRPELFFKATPHRVAAPEMAVRIRADSRWNVPEPELTLAISAHGRIFGYTIGNDMSSRDIEGENPLYLPQAKLYDGSAALGPCLVVSPELPAADTVIAIEILRSEAVVFADQTTVGRIKRSLPSLAEWLFRENRFPHGCYLMTGTGIVPPDHFTLQKGDVIRITIDTIGTLVNHVGG